MAAITITASHRGDGWRTIIGYFSETAELLVLVVITACAVATSCCISDASCHPHSSKI